MINAETGAISNYYTRMEVSPADENETYYLTGRFTKSIDGGVTLVDNR